jgi:hypothetical protein
MTYSGQSIPGDTRSFWNLPYISNAALEVSFAAPYTNIPHTVRLGQSQADFPNDVRDNARMANEWAPQIAQWMTTPVYNPELPFDTTVPGSVASIPSPDGALARGHRYYFFDVPEHSGGSITITLTCNATGRDYLDLGINTPNRPFWAPTVADSEIYLDSDSPNETHTFQNPAEGRYFVFVHRNVSGADGDVGFTLRIDSNIIPVQVAAPVFSPAGGTYVSHEPLTLPVTVSSATSRASIRYTLDGTEPTAAHGTLIANRGTGNLDFTESGTTTLKAIAFMALSEDSPVTAAAYTFNKIDAIPLYNDVPVDVTSDRIPLGLGDYYYFEVPPEAVGVTIRVYDKRVMEQFNLYVNDGAATSFPTTSSYTKSSQTGTAEDIVTFTGTEVRPGLHRILASLPPNITTTYPYVTYTIVATYDTTLEPPTNLRLAARTTRCLTLFWDAPEIGGIPTGYDVRYRFAGDGDWLTGDTPLSTEANSITVTSLERGVLYQFQVRSKNAVGVSEWTDVFSVATSSGLGLRPRGGGHDGAVSLSNGVSFNAINYFENDYYTFYVPANATSVTITLVGQIPTIDLDLYVNDGSRSVFPNRDEWDHRGFSATNIETINITPTTNPPLRPGLHRIMVDEWPNPTVAAPYTITASYTTAPAAPGVSMSFRATGEKKTSASGQLSRSGLQRRAFGTFARTTVPAAPTTVIASATPAVATLTPEPPANFRVMAANGNAVILAWTARPGLAEYDLQYRDSTASDWTAAPTPEASDAFATIAGLAGGTAYEFRLRTRNSSGVGSWSAWATVNASTQ